ncbi:MAG TPA: efflux RND transporter periplasmic adaptor subunit [Polyangiaceae bacterium]|nr:efflux RND transporter periplasmic adaptor subunit [Polyangiaceae bacterium]
MTRQALSGARPGAGARAVAGLGVALALGAGAAGCGRARGTKEPTPVRVATVEDVVARPPSHYGGTVRAETQIELAFKVGGYVGAVASAKGEAGGARLLREGDRVKKGAALAVLRQDDYALRLAELDGVRAQAEAAFKQAKLDHERAARLFEQGALARAEYDAAAARYEAARASRAATRAGAGGASVLLGDTKLKAPFDGVILRRDVEPGELVGPGKVAFVIAAVDRVKVSFAVPDALAATLAPGTPVALTAAALPGRRWSGAVATIAPSADDRTHAFGVEAEFDNADHALRVGQVADVELALPGPPPRPAVPLGAVVRRRDGGEGFVVYAVDEAPGGALARARPVVLGELAGGRVTLREGVRAGERVVSLGAALIADGDRVALVP